MSHGDRAFIDHHPDLPYLMAPANIGIVSAASIRYKPVIPGNAYRPPRKDHEQDARRA